MIKKDALIQIEFAGLFGGSETPVYKALIDFKFKSTIEAFLLEEYGASYSQTSQGIFIGSSKKMLAALKHLEETGYIAPMTAPEITKIPIKEGWLNYVSS